MATVLKTVVASGNRGFESHPLRQLPGGFLVFRKSTGQTTASPAPANAGPAPSLPQISPGVWHKVEWRRLCIAGHGGSRVARMLRVCGGVRSGPDNTVVVQDARPALADELPQAWATSYGSLVRPASGAQRRVPAFSKTAMTGPGRAELPRVHLPSDPRCRPFPILQFGLNRREQQ